eukprot:TRINITY_DN52072_c0_g1_i1.p1 TRINITY_DN52072_c0_g1~~TRINITY_DN52072_c0_g1_i1.p1  ORF type:complete len:288 (+),score=12.33 TRINITY_DN52072_c0_g1_i1:46-909(+)
MSDQESNPFALPPQFRQAAGLQEVPSPRRPQRVPSPRAQPNDSDSRPAPLKRQRIGEQPSALGERGVEGEPSPCSHTKRHGGADLPRRSDQAKGTNKVPVCSFGTNRCPDRNDHTHSDECLLRVARKAQRAKAVQRDLAAQLKKHHQTSKQYRAAMQRAADTRQVWLEAKEAESCLERQVQRSLKRIALLCSGCFVAVESIGPSHHAGAVIEAPRARSNVTSLEIRPGDQVIVEWGKGSKQNPGSHWRAIVLSLSTEKLRVQFTIDNRVAEVLRSKVTPLELSSCTT